MTSACLNQFRLLHVQKPEKDVYYKKKKGRLFHLLITAVNGLGHLRD